MKQNFVAVCRKAAVFFHRNLSTIGLGLALGLAGWPAAAWGDEVPARIIVKFRATLAQQVEAALPASLEMDQPAGRVRPDFFTPLGGHKLKPLYPELLRHKKQRAASDERLADDVKKKFAPRAARAPVGARSPALSRSYVLEFPGASEAALAVLVAQLNLHAEVEFAEREQVYAVQFTPNDTYFASSGTWGQAYLDLWGLNRINAATAWDTTHGQGVIVAVVDTGLDVNHADIAANVWVNTGEIPGNGIDDDGNGFIDDVQGWDFVGASYLTPAPDNNPADAHGHGTHVAGTIAATGNNGLGVVGVAWGAKVMAVRSLDNGGTGTDAQLANAVIYAANNGADVINNSYGGKGFSQTLLDAMNYAHSLGAVVIVSAGNDAARAEENFPASFPNVITVGATMPDDGLAYYSNWGSKIDVTAPGDDILSLRAAGTTLGPVVGNNYVRLSGTSMAAPHVAGVAALVLAQQPTLTAEQVRQVLRFSADDLYVPGADIYFGSGRLHAANALTVAAPLEAKIQSPMEGQPVAGPVTFTGVAQGPNFSSYVLDYGTSEAPTSWTTIAQGTTPVNGTTLGSFEPNLPDGRHEVRLRAYDGSGRVFADRVSILVSYVSITSPATPATPPAAQTFKPGVVLPLLGSARGPSFTQYRVEWARGQNPGSGWTTAGLTVVNGGAVPITNGLFATFDTASLTQADFYTIRLLVDNAGFTTEVRTMINLEPSLISTNWPQLLQGIPTPWGGLVPARDAAGTLRQFMVQSRPADPLHSYLFGFAANATGVELMLSTSASFQPAAGNLDGLPGDEVVVGDNNVVRVLRSDLTSYSFTPAPSVSFKNSRAVIEDLNNDGSNEIVIIGDSGLKSYLYAFKPDGQLLTPNFPIVLTNGNSFQTDAPGRFLVVDLNGDGLKEILAVESTTWSNCVVRAFKWDGTPYPWPAVQVGNHIIEMAAGDTDGDGIVDIAIAALTGGSQDVFAQVNADGTMKAGWPQMPNPYLGPGARLALADLDGDGRDEMIASSVTWLFALKSDGSSFGPSWPIYCQNTENISLADVDGDGFPEVLATQGLSINNYNEYRVLAFRRDATIARNWLLTGRDGLASARGAGLSAGDFDGDGVLDIAAWYSIGGYGMATVFSANTPYNPATVPWPVNFRDARNSSVVARSNGAPSVRLTSPMNGAVLSGVVTLTATASDDVSVVGLQFKLDNTNLGAEFATPPYSLSWDTRTTGNGAHTLSAVARDAAGHVTVSAITITATNDIAPPTVSIASPANNARVGGTFTITASASDNVGVVGVQFRIDGANFGAEDLTAPYSISWDSTTVPIGVHTLTAVARDAAGNSRTSAVVTVTVTNVVKINFQPAAAPIYAGYFVDAGSNYASRGNGYNYGWSTSNSANAFDRNSASSQDQRYDTLITMQIGGTFTWEIVVPNGRYSVHVVAGDANFFNSIYKINVENVLTVNATPKSNQRWKEGTATVTVSDGRLTVSNASGASNNKICFLEITPLP